MNNLQRSVSTQAQLRRILRKELKNRLKLQNLSEPIKAASPVYRGYPTGMRTVRFVAEN